MGITQHKLRDKDCLKICSGINKGVRVDKIKWRGKLSPFKPKMLPLTPHFVQITKP